MCHKGKQLRSFYSRPGPVPGRYQGLLQQPQGGPTEAGLGLFPDGSAEPHTSDGMLDE